MMFLNKIKYAEIGRKMRAIPPEPTDSSYEWEELVQKLCASDDIGLHDIGIKELAAMNKQRPVNKTSRTDETI